jgi:urea transport system ATP-binding protein
MNVMDTRATSAMLYLDGVHVSFDGFHAINNLSLTLEPGEMRAIIGPNGAGKTTMMDIITGKTKPDEGTVLFDGVTDLTRLDETRIAELGIGRKFQKPTVFESRSASPTPATASPAASVTARSSGSRSACCWRRIQNSCWSTNLSPA